MNEKNQFIEDLYTYFPDDWKILFKDYDQTKKVISNVSRELPPDAYEFIREHMIDQLFLMKINNQLPN